MTSYNLPAKRIFVEKREGFRTRANSLKEELAQRLDIRLPWLRLFSVYDLFGFDSELINVSKNKVFAEPAVDDVYDTLPDADCRILAIEPLPGQFDQRAASAIDCVHLIKPEADINIISSQLIMLPDSVSDVDYDRIASYCLNPVESRVKDLESLSMPLHPQAEPVEFIEGFTSITPKTASQFCSRLGLAMNADDLMTAVRYFKSEKRNPTFTELRILDTYWSDHCRHTTFNTALNNIEIKEGTLQATVNDILEQWQNLRLETKRFDRPFTLMDLATIAAKSLRKRGLTPDVEVSEENNACSVFIDVDVATPSGETETQKWLLQFKNETHNHPTEIEPFGGASTCLGGAIRDPLSGRSYVYQAMRITGAADPTASIESTLPGKLPQVTISKKAAAGYSSYGNQFGIATTCVREIFHPGYVAKRMEVGAVVGAVPADNIQRLSPLPGDAIIMLGGATGRDGIGGATGSSKKHDNSSLTQCGSEVQKGNAPEERKIARLFRRKDVTSLIKKSNDFGAGGVSVAIGELADGLDIFLDRVPLKYAGLNSTEIAISESQERMAVVIDANDVEKFLNLCNDENINAVHVANVTDTQRMRIYHKGSVVADLKREFIDSAGAPRYADAVIDTEIDPASIMRRRPATCEASLKDCILANLADPNVASQKGLAEMFDASIGRSTVLMPFGGASQLTEAQVSAQTLPVEGARTASVMAYGVNPYLLESHTMIGAAYACVESLARLASAGARWHQARFSFQEYFQRMDSEKAWGLPLAALLGTLKMQMDFQIPAIGGKDSMSGTFNDISVPPTLISFAVTTADTDAITSPEFKAPGQYIYLVAHTPLSDGMPDTDTLISNFDAVQNLISSHTADAAMALGFGGLAEAICKMMLGNNIGAEIIIPKNHDSQDFLFNLNYGSIVMTSSEPLEKENFILIGKTVASPTLVVKYSDDVIAEITIAEIHEANISYLKEIYPDKKENNGEVPCADDGEHSPVMKWPGTPTDSPLVAIPVFPGTNCDYDIANAFSAQGARCEVCVFRNLTSSDVEESVKNLANLIDRSHILAISGGFSAGDEPDGSGKFIANVLLNDKVAAAVQRLINRRGLILGICNGFQALVKSGLLPTGKIGVLSSDSPTLFTNDINRHISQIVTTRVGSTRSPWLSSFHTGELHQVAASHGEGKFTVDIRIARELLRQGQIAFQYATPEGEPTMQSPYNPNGSVLAIEGIISPDGLILGKMAHSERWRAGLMKNIHGNADQNIFKNAVNYFKTR